MLDIALAAAARSADLLQARAGDRAALRWEEKKHADFVTEVDRASEEQIRAVIRDLAPEARVLGEELSPTLGGTTPVTDLPGIVFVADPLDGTTNYLHGYPAYAVSIGVIVDGVLTAGVVRHAVTGDSYTAIVGEGAYRNGERITVSPITDPGRALIGTGFPFSSIECARPISTAVRRHCAPDGRDPSRGIGRPGPRRRRSGSFRRILGAQARALGHRRRDPAGARVRRDRD